MLGRRVKAQAIQEGMKPGDYALGEDNSWHLFPPDGNIGVLSPAHKVTEHNDGTISVWPSILDESSGYHGWLIKGEWKTNYHG